ncbi:MAG: metal-binding protein ZinT [Candidatus Atribacteria bacterium]|nr:metal-binding protein ZinT [Candidatus Atribacteria bacterium]
MIRNRLTIVIAGMLVLVLMAYGIGMAQEESEVSDLSLWEGENETYVNIFDTASAGELFNEIAKYVEGYDGEMVRNFYNKFYETPFSTIRIMGKKTVIFDEEIEADYEYIGVLNTKWGEYNIAWHIFRTDNSRAIDAGYRHLILMPYHGHGEGSIRHCHMRYGNENFDFLTTDPSISNWWPTLYRPNEVNKEEVVKNMMGQAKMLADTLKTSEK